MQRDLFDAEMSASEVYALTPHVCSACGGRILRREAGGLVQYRCSECGRVGNAAPESICCCGVKRSNGKHFLRCVVNPDRKPGFMNEIVVEEFGY